MAQHQKNAVHDSVQDYYARVLKTKHDLQTTACCPASSVPAYLRPYLSNIHETVQDKFYGCGAVIPPLLDGCTVLDLGCGAGHDAYILAQLTGPKGRVIGVDMTEAQLETARAHLDWHMERFGYDTPNIDFRRGFIEDLNTAGIADNSIDVVVSNCVINLSPDKQAVFKEIFRVLKPGGELYFSDVFAGRRVPDDLKTDPVLLGECLGGALYIEDFRRILREAGCLDYRVISRTALDLKNPALEEKIGMVDFYAMTVRAFHCEFEDICENYGQTVLYKGTAPQAQHRFVLDDHHVFETGLSMPVCGNTAKMLSETRLSPHFHVEGDVSVHYGPFSCGPVSAPATQASGGCC